MTRASAHKRAVRQAFDRAAASYDRAARVQREACARLFGLARAWPPAAPVLRLVDAGCGTGHALAGLGELCPDALQLALDFSPAMLARARASADATIQPLCADLEHLPLHDASIDLLWSSLAMQWCTPQTTLKEVARVLVPGGTAWIATLGPRTLHELRTAFASVDDDEHVIDFAEPGHWVACAQAAGLESVACERSEIAAVAPDLRTLLADIKAIGAQTVGAGRRRRPLGKRAWAALQLAYDAHRRADGQLPATYDLILLALRKPS